MFVQTPQDYLSEQVLCHLYFRKGNAHQEHEGKSHMCNKYEQGRRLCAICIIA